AECSLGFSLFLQGCVKLCPPGFTSGPQLLNLSLENWVDLSSVQACLPCHSACLTCSDTGPSDCLSCPPHSRLLLTSCLHQNQVQRKSPPLGGAAAPPAAAVADPPASAPAEDEGPLVAGGGGVEAPPTRLPAALVAALCCALVLAAFVGVFVLLQARSRGAPLGWRTVLPSARAHPRGGPRVGLALGLGRGEGKARVCYRGIPTVWGDEDSLLARHSESDSEEAEAHGERTAFIKTQSAI
ncbi:furin-like, partial [Nelusetta ayraudi]|uniref:furin-like n=1 Tax=Nelusetta ayraudi TaxID=303726 RepID=UPI003F71A5D6